MKRLILVLLLCISCKAWASWSPVGNDLMHSSTTYNNYWPPIINSEGNAMMIIDESVVTAYGRALGSDWNKIGELFSSDPLLVELNDFNRPIEASSSLERLVTYTTNKVIILDYANGVWSTSAFTLPDIVPDSNGIEDIGISKNGQRIATLCPPTMDGSNQGNFPYILISENVLGNWVSVGEPIKIASQYTNGIQLNENGDTLIFAPNNNTSGVISEETVMPVKVYSYANGSWIQKGGNIYPLDDFDGHGRIVRISGDGQRIAISSHLADGLLGPNKGRVDIYQYDNNNWQLIDRVFGDNPGDQFGFSFSLSNNGNRIAIGSDYHSINQEFYNGHIKAFDYDSSTNTYVQVGDDINGSEYESIGGKFAMSGDGTTIISMNGYFAAEFNGLEYISTLKTYSYGAPTDESLDTDGDGLTNATELSLGTNPNLEDTDGDGFPDGWEVDRNLDPTINSSDFISNINAYGYYSTEQISDLRPGSTMIEVQNGQATLSMEVEQSDDLEIWTSGGTTNLQVPIDPNSDTKFFRFKMAE